MSHTLPTIIEQIHRTAAPKGMASKIIAIDGCGGAGKSTLALKLSKCLNNCPVIHTDDFASWDNSQNWFPRMLEQVLIPLLQNQVAKFQKYDWNEKRLAEWITVEPQEFIILEGVTSARKEFRPYLTFSIFVKTNRELRLKRGLARDGKDAKVHWLRWMQEEDQYLIRDNPQAYANLIVSGTETAYEKTVLHFSPPKIKSPYSFEPMRESDLPLLFKWANEAHVKKWWDTEVEWEDFRRRYSNNIQSCDSFPFIVSFGGTPIGYINFWMTEDDPDFQNLFPNGSVGTDQFIGVKDILGKGHGSKFVTSFTDWLLEQPDITAVMTDPDISNYAAIRCYQKAGFQKIKEMKTVDGSVLLMERRR